MDHIGLIELGIKGDTIEQERIEWDPVFRRQIGIDPVEGRGVTGTPISGRLHAQEDRLDARRAQFSEDLIEIASGQLGIDPPQRIIGAQLDKNIIGVVGKRPVEPGKAAGGRVAADPGIAHGRVISLGGQRGLQPHRERIVEREPEACRQTVAESQNLDGCRQRRAYREPQDSEE